MSLTSTTADWADDTYIFDLPMAQIEELQEKTGQGPLRLLRNIDSGDWRAGDLREVIRLGLIGGGMDAVAALKLVRNYFDPTPAAHILLAHGILWAWMKAVPKKKTPPTDQATEQSASTSTPSTEPAPQ